MQKAEPSLGAVLTAVIVVLIYAAGALCWNRFMPPTSMLFTVLKKGATYALVAVSMNLLNGFTGSVLAGTGGLHAHRGVHLRHPDHPGSKAGRWCISTMTAA